MTRNKDGTPNLQFKVMGTVKSLVCVIIFLPAV